MPIPKSENVTVPVVNVTKSTINRARLPFNTHNLRLPLPDLDGFVCRYFNDEEGRINRALDAGYEFVNPIEFRSFKQASNVAPNNDLGSRISVLVGFDDQGEPLRAYLMKLKSELYEEDQVRKQERLDEIDESIKFGRMGDPQGSYVKEINYKAR